MRASASAAPAPELALQDQRRMVHALHAALQAQMPTMPVELIETHISYVLVGPQWAYKLKKAVNPGFLDFTTLALRRHFCEEELRLNRRLAPALYLEVVAVTGTPAQPRLGGGGPVIDHALKMRAFDQAGLWDRLARRGALHAAQVDDLALQLHRFHETAAVAPATSRFGEPRQVREPMLDNLQVLGQQLQGAGERAWLDALRRWEADEFGALAPWWPVRHAAQRVRECHGDLHLGNVAQIDGRCTVFDCVEFNDDFRWIDVMNEIAFMAMVLHSHGLAPLAHRFVNACLEQSGDYAGARVLRYYYAHRALVRAKVALLRAAQAGAAAAEARTQALHYLELVAACTGLAGVEGEAVPPHALRPAVLVTHGYSGSGKTSGSQALLQTVGAIRIRADVERKRLFGLEPLARSRSSPGAGLYTPQASAATLAHLLQAAAPVLAGGYAVLLDATFLQRTWRDAARVLAQHHGVPFFILDFEVAPAQLRQRIDERVAERSDASEADPDVLAAQLRSAQPLQADEQDLALHCPADAMPGSQEFEAQWAAFALRLQDAVHGH